MTGLTCKILTEKYMYHYQIMYVYITLSDKDTEYRTYSIKYERIIILTVLLHLEEEDALFN